MLSKRNDIGKESLILTISQFIVLGINMVNVMLLSRVRTLEEYGTYSQVIMVCTLIVNFLSAGFAQCINYFLGKSDTEEEKTRFIKSYYTIVSGVSLAGGVLTLMALPVIQSYFGNDGIRSLWFVLLLYPFSHILNSGIDRFFIAYKKAKGLLVLRVTYSVIILSEVLLAIVLDMSFYEYMVMFTLIEVIHALLDFLWIRIITGVLPLGYAKGALRMILGFAIPMAFASAISTINTEMDKLIVGGLVSTGTMAIYTNAAKELPVTIISTSISSVTMPHMVRRVQQKEMPQAARLWSKSIILSAYVMMFFICVLFVFAPQVIRVLYSEKYVSGANVFRVYTLVLLFRITYYGMALNAMGKTKTILLSSVLTMVINLILDLALYWLLGIIGPAIATLVSVAVMNMCQLILTKRLMKVRFTDIYPVKELLRILLLNAAMGAVFFGAQQGLFRVCSFDQTVLTIALGVVWMIVYAIAVRKPVLRLWKELNA